jgi:hypothetical protein
MRFPTIRKGIDTSEVVLSSLAEGENTSRNRAELPLSTAESNSSRSSPDHRRTPELKKGRVSSRYCLQGGDEESKKGRWPGDAPSTTFQKGEKRGKN